MRSAFDLSDAELVVARYTARCWRNPKQSKLYVTSINKNNYIYTPSLSLGNEAAIYNKEQLQGR